MLFRVFQRGGTPFLQGGSKWAVSASSRPASRVLSPSLAPSMRNYTNSTPIVAMPLKAVEIMSLGQTAQKGILTETPMIEGSLVQAGDIVGIVKDLETDKTYEIPSPTTGRLVQLHASTNDEVSVGDTLVTIDTDAIAQSVKTAAATAEGEDNEDVKQFLQSLEDNKGELSDEHVKRLCSTITEVDTLRTIASLLMQRFPNTPLQVKALPFLQQVLELQVNQHQDDKSDHDNRENTLEIATTHTDLGILLYRLGDLEAAITQLEVALKLRETALDDPMDPELSATLIHIGAMKNQLQDLDGCFAAFSRALEIQKQHLGESHPLVAASLNNLGAICYHQSKFSQAIPYYQQALEIYKQVDGGDKSTDTAGSYNNLAVAMKHVGDVKGAIDHCRTALKIRQETVGDNHIDTAISHYCLGQIFSETQQYDAALEQLEIALKIQKEHYGTVNHPTPATTHNHMGAIYYEQGIFDKALADYQVALEAFQKAAGEDAPQVADCWNNVGMAQAKLQQFDEALTSHQNAKQILETKFGATHPTLAMTLANIGSVLKSQGKFDEALLHYRQAHPMLEATLGVDHDMVGSSYNNMGQVLALQGKLEDALTVYQAALAIFKKTLSEDHVFTGSIHYNIGLVLQQQQQGEENKEQAKESYQQAYNIWRAALGPEHAQTQLAEQAIDAL